MRLWLIELFLGLPDNRRGLTPWARWDAVIARAETLREQSYYD